MTITSLFSLPCFVLRSLYGALAVLFPAIIALTAGITLWAVTRNKRRALNSMTTLLGWIGSIVAGLRICVENVSNLDQHRPAVFIFNHQSGIDPIILCRLLRKDIVGVAKIELKTHPVLGPLLRFGDTLFVDRHNTQSTAQFIDDANTTLSRSLSIAIAPEGKRTTHAHVNPFKSGAFRLAREANSPIVPIIIFNAKAILKPNRLDIRPGRVYVKILPAILPSEWQDQSSDDMAKALHEIYLTHLDTYDSQCNSSFNS